MFCFVFVFCFLLFLRKCHSLPTVHRRHRHRFNSRHTCCNEHVTRYWHVKRSWQLPHRHSSSRRHHPRRHRSCLRRRRHLKRCRARHICDRSLTSTIIAVDIKMGLLYQALHSKLHRCLVRAVRSISSTLHRALPHHRQPAHAQCSTTTRRFSPTCAPCGRRVSWKNPSSQFTP